MLRVKPSGAGLSAYFITLIALLSLAAAGWAQNATTGAISGVVSDPSGAVIPGATVTATSASDGSIHTTTTQINGHYLLPLLKPGDYTVTVAHTGFSTLKRSPVSVAVSGDTNLDAQLKVGESTQTVEVTGAPPLIQPDNANIESTLNATAIANLPNPGNDLTFLAQNAPGATMQKGSFFNATYNGLPGTSANFTIDGGSYNDPFLGLNNSGPTNLSLGANDIQEVTVATNPYSVDQGHAESANINYVSKRGGNDFHGNAEWQWNGRTLNAYDTFVKSVPVSVGGPLPPKPFDNVNNYAGSIGGPILHNKWFFFVDDEGARIDLPVVSSGNVVPTANFIKYAAQQLAVGGCETNPQYFLPTANNGAAPATGNCAVNGATQPGVANGQNGNYLYLPPEPQETAFQQHELGLYQINNPKLQLTPNAAFGCNLDPQFVSSTNPLGVDPNYVPQLAGGQATGDANLIPSDTGCEDLATFSGSNLTWENKLVARTDWNPNPTNSFWFAYNNDRGLQATGLSADNPIFNTSSFQPSWGTNMDWTHVFSSSLVSDAAFDTSWYSAPFGFADQSVVNQIQPWQFNSPFDTLGSQGFPQGRNVTILTLFDNVTYTRGAHQFKFGTNYMRERITDFDFVGSEVPSISAGSFAELEYGTATDASVNFPINATQPIRLFDVELYGGDTWQVTPHLTFIYGVRASTDSNPKDPQGTFGNPTDWEQMVHNVNISPAQDLFASGKLFNAVPFTFWQPRVAFSYQPWENTVFKGGWGMFEAVAPGVTADNMIANPPFDPAFGAGYDVGELGAIPPNAGANNCAFSAAGTGQCGVLMDPSQPNSVTNAMLLANQAFQQAFASKALSCAASGAPANCIPVQSLFIQPQAGLKEPYADEWSFGIERQFGRNLAFTVNYVGNRSYHDMPSVFGGGVDVNAFQTLCAGCLAPFPFSASGTAPDPRYSSVTQLRFDGYSTYNGLQTQLTERGFHGLTLALNYAWAHALATGTPISDSIPVSDTYRDQAGTPYNVLSANYTYQLPWHVGGSLLGGLVNGWQISGATFAQTGQPIFINGGSVGSVLFQTPDLGSRSFIRSAYELKGVNPYSKNVPLPGVGDINTATSGSGFYQWLNPNAFISMYNHFGTGSCYDPGSGQYAGPNAADCQFPATNAYHLFGPGFEWTNFFLTKNFQITEGMRFRLDAQAYNLFNHPNYSNPNTNAIIPGHASTLVNAGTISSLTAPSTGLLGNGLGGDNAPRMIAIQGEIIF